MLYWNQSCSPALRVTMESTDFAKESGWSAPMCKLWDEGFGATVLLLQEDVPHLAVNCGASEKLTPLKAKELCAVAARQAQKMGVEVCEVNVEPFTSRFGVQAVHAVAQGISCGVYRYSQKQETAPVQTNFYAMQTSVAQQVLDTEAPQAWALACRVLSARDWVNTPGNQLPPAVFAQTVQQQTQGLPIESECFDLAALRAMGFSALPGIGQSSANAPCLVVLRYNGAPTDSARLGIAGKGVTCDAGGYCIKSAGSMSGIKGDMAGAAAAASALCALAENKVPVNVTVCLPMCENRISPDALLPGDVLTMYGGKRAEVLNTDAEGRLILAEAVAYLVAQEKVTQIVDIATLTGAAWSALGYTMAPAVCDDDMLYRALEQAQQESAERFVRFPFGEEHEKMIRSEVADIKNVGGDCCGVITAGLFIRAFAAGVPWLHLDIAGTAWTSTPNYKFESFGATGAGTTTLYHLARVFAQQ